MVALRIERVQLSGQIAFSRTIPFLFPLQHIAIVGLINVSGSRSNMHCFSSITGAPAPSEKKLYFGFQNISQMEVLF